MLDIAQTGQEVSQKSKSHVTWLSSHPMCASIALGAETPPVLPSALHRCPLDVTALSQLRSVQGGQEP